MPFPRCTALLLTSMLLLAPGALAQTEGRAALTGTVVDAETGAPLEGVNVFIASSQRGTVTGADGRYRLDGLPLGAQRLYLSYVGYEPVAKDTLLREARAYQFDARMEPAVLALDDVTVEAERDEQWQRRLQRFTRLFIGETPNAEQTEILNPEVLNFDSQRGAFTARAAEPLVIENQALGYRIRYFLDEFEALPTGRTRYDGEPLFEPMEPASAAQAARWSANRREAYRGSLRHFLRTLLADRVEEEGFKMYSRPAPRSIVGGGPFGSAGNAGPRSALDGRRRFPIGRGDLVENDDDPTATVLDIEGFVQIIYTGEMESEAYLAWRNQRRRPKYRTAHIQLEDGPTVVDYKGDMLDPYGITQYDYYAFERVADEVPREYALSEE